MNKFQPYLFHCKIDPANTYLFQVKDKNIRERCEIYSELTIKTPERRN